ncbi:hypothetical protein BHE94_04315 [Bacillus pumilus]|nr:hypothetical protein BHE94_04315 [Bacillus pumilus]
MKWTFLSPMAFFDPVSKGTGSYGRITILRKYKKPKFPGVISEKLGFRYFRRASFYGVIKK